RRGGHLEAAAGDDVDLRGRVALVEELLARREPPRGRDAGQRIELLGDQPREQRDPLDELPPPCCALAHAGPPRRSAPPSLSCLAMVAPVTHAAADPERGRRFAFVPGAGAPFPVARTEGAWLILPDGRRILDAAGGAIVANVGHGRREVAQAVARALERIDYVVPPFATEERVALVERLVERWLPPGLVRVAFTSGGSESVDAALRLARQHHVAAGRAGRREIVRRAPPVPRTRAPPRPPRRHP